MDDDASLDRGQYGGADLQWTGVVVCMMQLNSGELTNSGCWTQWSEVNLRWAGVGRGGAGGGGGERGVRE